MNIKGTARNYVIKRIPERTPEWVSRGYTLFLILFLAIIFGAIGLVPSITSAIFEKEWITLSALVTAYMVTLIIFLSKDINFHVRSYALCLAIIVVGYGSYHSIGLIGSSRIWFLCASVLACLLVGWKAALFIFFLSLLSLIGFGVRDHFELALPSEPDHVLWMITSTTFVLVNILVLGSTYLIVFGLEKAEKKIRDSEVGYKALSEQLRDRLRHEEVIAACSQDLVRGGPDAVHTALGRLVGATRVGRVHVFENVNDPEGGLCMRLKWEAVTEGVVPEIKDRLLQHMPYQGSGFEQWAEILGKGGHINGAVDAFPESERKCLEPRGIRSTLVIPIAIGRHWWGFIEFDELHSRRDWDEEEIRLLRVAAQLLGTHIERNRAEEELRESEQFRGRIIESLASGLYVYNIRDGRNEFISPQYTALTGWTLEDIHEMGESFSQLFHSEDRPQVKEHFDRLMQAGDGEILEVEYRFRTRDERWIWCVSRDTVFERNGRGEVVRFVGSFVDITESKAREEEKAQLEEQYMQAQRAESIGRLAAGVAHDLNNLLSPILGYSDMLRHDMDPKDERRESVHQIMSAGLRARDLVRQLLAFSRKQILEFKPVDLNHVLSGLEKLLRRAIREDIEMAFDLPDEAQVVMADVGQIEQVIMNLSVNAADAMPEGGRLTIQAHRVSSGQAYPTNHPCERADEYVKLTITDTGCGMDEATREKIFEPFFSTKGEGGTGLGLSTVYGIVKQHGGKIRVDSAPEMGTTFTIYLPVPDTLRAEEKRSTEPPRRLEGSETILVVEDNNQMRELAHSVLIRKGYRVLAAKDGAEAMEVFAVHVGSISLLLTDVVLPCMNGRELYEEAAKRNPALKVLYMSGYTGDVIAHRGVLDEGVHMIQKPFTVQELAAKVRELLDEETDRAENAYAPIARGQVL